MRVGDKVSIVGNVRGQGQTARVVRELSNDRVILDIGGTYDLVDLHLHKDRSEYPGNKYPSEGSGRREAASRQAFNGYEAVMKGNVGDVKVSRFPSFDDAVAYHSGVEDELRKHGFIKQPSSSESNDTGAVMSTMRHGAGGLFADISTRQEPHGASSKVSFTRTASDLPVFLPKQKLKHLHKDRDEYPDNKYPSEVAGGAKGTLVQNLKPGSVITDGELKGHKVFAKTQRGGKGTPWTIISVPPGGALKDRVFTEIPVGAEVKATLPLRGPMTDDEAAS